MGKTRRTCAYPGCGTYLTATQAHCRDHAHVNALQQVIDRETKRRSGGVAALIDNHDPLRRILNTLDDLTFRAQVGKSMSMATIGREGFDDGTADYGESVVHSPAAAAVRSDQGKLEAATKVLNSTARKIEDIADPNTQRRVDLRPRCQAKGCKSNGARQMVNQPTCGWCGASFD